MSNKSESVWSKADKWIDYLMPVILILLIIYLYSSFIDPIISQNYIKMVGNIIIVFFFAEIMVKYAISEDYKYFLRNYWIKILLILPFFKALKILKSYKIVATVGKSIKAFKIIPKIQKLIKIPKVVRKIKKVILKHLKDEN